MVACPKCGKPMRIEKEKGKRVWRCPDLFNCMSWTPIDDDTQLTIKTIAEDMARGWASSSEERAREQTALRRVAGGIKNNAASKYLSVEEVDILLKAAEVLERLASSAERAKKESARLEKEEAARRAQRYEEAGVLFEQSFISNLGLKDAILCALTLCKLNNNHYHFVRGAVLQIDKIAKARGKTFLEALTHEVKTEIQDELREMKNFISYRDIPVDVLVDEVLVKYEQVREIVIHENKIVLDELYEAITIHTSDNIVKLDLDIKR